MNLRELVVNELNVEVLDGNKVTLDDLEQFVLHLFDEGNCYHVDRVFVEQVDPEPWAPIFVDLFRGERI